MSRVDQVRAFLAQQFFGDIIAERERFAVKVVDDKWWAMAGNSLQRVNDVPWGERQSTLKDALEAWRVNPLARQIVRLTRGFVLQDGLKLIAKNKRDQKFVDDFWGHRQNRMDRRLRLWCDALVLNGEIFPTLFLNPADGMTYVRSVSARVIDGIETDQDDLERALRFHQRTDALDGKWWSVDNLVGTEMLHFVTNPIEGAVRGSGDLDPILIWLERYKTWLTDRVAINKAKTRLAWDVTINGAVDAEYIQRRKVEIAAAMQTVGGVNIHNDREGQIQAVYPGIAADSVADDGRALRLMISAGIGVPLQHFGESDSANRASAGSADRAMLTHYRLRQQELIEIAIEVTQRAAARSKAAGRLNYSSSRGFVLEPQIGELTKEDNLMLAQAARQVVEALDTARTRGWVDDDLAVRLMLKFAGEVIPEEVFERLNTKGVKERETREINSKELENEL